MRDRGQREAEVGPRQSGISFLGAGQRPGSSSQTHEMSSYTSCLWGSRSASIPQIAPPLLLKLGYRIAFTCSQLTADNDIPKCRRHSSAMLCCTENPPGCLTEPILGSGRSLAVMLPSSTHGAGPHGMALALWNGQFKISKRLSLLA